MNRPKRLFELADQQAFARLSGDWNPMHLDAVYARRTVAGQPVVHGVHLLLWALDRVAAEGCPPLPSRIVANFSRFVLVGELVELMIERPRSNKMRLLVMSAGNIRTEITLMFREGGACPEAVTIEGPVRDPDCSPVAIPEDAIDGLKGTISALAGPADFAVAFSAAAGWLGAERLSAIAAATRLVGMICPGLHSLFTELIVSPCAVPTGGAALGFQMAGPRHGLVTGRLAGGGITGSIACIMRQPPRAQPAMTALSLLVEPAAFEGSDALVIGGSRGLGELTAKLIAAGGGAVTLTYANGKVEAEQVAAEIEQTGRHCELLRYRVGEDAEAQLSSLGSLPTHVYFFAAPMIARPPGSRFFDAGHLARLHRIFVDGFWNLATAIHARGVKTALFYPSTIYVETRPPGFGEYAMAKAAGEILCAEIDATMAPLRTFVGRLPRLATDQTVGVLGIEDSDPVGALLPLVREVQAY